MGGTYLSPILMATKEAPQTNTVKRAFIEALTVVFIILPFGIKIPPPNKVEGPVSLPYYKARLSTIRKLRLTSQDEIRRFEQLSYPTV
jgi:hypothetical protein